MSASRSPSPSPSAANAALIDAFCDQLWLQDGLAPASLAAYRRDLVAWTSWLEGEKRAVLAADRGDVERWRLRHLDTPMGTPSGPGCSGPTAPATGEPWAHGGHNRGTSDR